MKFDSYLPYEFTPEGMLQRMNSYIENQMFCKWPLEGAVSLFLGEKGQSCSETCRKHGWYIFIDTPSTRTRERERERGCMCVCVCAQTQDTHAPQSHIILTPGQSVLSSWCRAEITSTILNASFSKATGDRTHDLATMRRTLWPLRPRFVLFYKMVYM